MPNRFMLQIDHLIKILVIEVENLQTKAFEREISKLGITQQKFAILHEIIRFEGSPTPYTIAHRIIFESNSVSALINRMQTDGLVTKHKDMKQKHMVRIELTEKGKNIFNEALTILNKVNKELMSNLTWEEKEQLTYLLTILRDNAMPTVYPKGKSLTPWVYKPKGEKIVIK